MTISLYEFFQTRYFYVFIQHDVEFDDSKAQAAHKYDLPCIPSSCVSSYNKLLIIIRVNVTVIIALSQDCQRELKSHKLILNKLK